MGACEVCVLKVTGEKTVPVDQECGYMEGVCACVRYACVHCTKLR